MELETIDVTSFRSVIVFASYFEAENLGLLLEKVSLDLKETDLVVIADDSGKTYRNILEAHCNKAMEKSQAKIAFSYSNVKSGRGAAIRRVFSNVHSRGPQVQQFIESDSDGSHRPEDLLRILEHPSDANLLIGSRYSKGSSISGWPLSRRLFSRTLNFLIPKVLGVPSKDLTNGLRKYDRKAVATLLKQQPVNSGFIYLSEVAYLLSRANLKIEDLPIDFENRVHGASTVGTLEIFKSLMGLWGLMLLRVKAIAGF